MILSYNSVQFVNFKFYRSSKFKNIIFFDNTPFDINSFLKTSNNVDLPLLLIPVITFIRFWSLSCLNLSKYTSRCTITFFDKDKY